MPLETSPTTLNQRIQQGEDLYLLDVREPWEAALCQLPDAVNIPMGQIPGRLGELPADRTVVCICHHGMRSLQVAHYLESNGMDSVENLTGGVEGWARDVDPEMPRY